MASPKSSFTQIMELFQQLADTLRRRCIEPSIIPHSSSKKLALISTGTIACACILKALFARSELRKSTPTGGISKKVVSRVLDSNMKKRYAISLSEAIKINAVSGNDLSEIELQTFHEKILEFHKFLEKRYPNVHQHFHRSIINNYSLVYELKGSDPSLKPYALLAHMDVVPAPDESDESKGEQKLWKYPPFSGTITDDGYIYGRGAIDCKYTLISILEAVELLIKHGFKFRRSIFLCFGHDEEISGPEGAQKIVPWLLEERKIDPKGFEFVLDEGGAIISELFPMYDHPIALVSGAEKGYATVKLTARVEAGHSSMPPQETSVGVLAKAIHKLETQNKVPLHFNSNSPLYKTLELVGKDAKWPLKLVLCNMWLFSPLLKYAMLKIPGPAAMIRSTTAPTVLRAGEKDNVMPYVASCIVNHRIHPRDSIEYIVEHDKRVIADERVTVEVTKAFHSKHESDVNSEVFDVIRNTIKDIFPEVVVSPSLVVGGTDSRYYEPLSRLIFRFSPVKIKNKELSMIHGFNERASVDNLAEGVLFIYSLISRMN